jgi:hypothetical protein
LTAPTCTTPANRIRACGQWESPVVDPQTGCPTCVAAAAPSACGLPAADAGPCKAALPRWTYDAATGACRRFVYGGCGGNANNFETLEACTRGCNVSACGLPAADAGPCKAALPRWTYDAATGACRRFVYGGCAGNANNFETREACERQCEPDPCSLPAKRAGECKGALSRWSYDAATRSCERFVYSGCGGNTNNFESRAECARRCPVACACPPGRPVCGADRRTYASRCEADCKGVTVAAEGECSAVISMCSLASEPGPCKAALPRWSYRPATGECERFVYGGCGGNANNFETREACLRSCAP